MPTSSSTRADLLRLTAAACGFVGLECLLALPAAWAHPLDPDPRSAEALLLTWLVVVGAGGIGRLMRAPSLIAGAVIGWGLFVFTEGAHVRGDSPWLWSLLLLPVVPFALASRRWAVWLIPCMALVVPLRRPPVDPPVPGDGKTRLLVITVDTVRADASLLEEAGLLRDPSWSTGSALAAAPWTPPSMMSLWLAADVTEHGGGVEVDGRLTEPREGWATSWPNAYAGVGARSEAVVSNPYLRPELGFSEGFGAFWHDSHSRNPHLVIHTAEATRARLMGHDTSKNRQRDDRAVTVALERLDALDAPDVLWVHLLEPHEYPRRVGSADPGARRRGYAAGVVETADRVRALIARADDAAIVVVGDHGESLGEEGRWGHGRAPVPEVLQVPLAVRPASAWSNQGRSVPSLPDVGRWLRQRAHDPAALLAVGSAPTIAGVRGDPQRRFRWNEALKLAAPMSGEVVLGPLAPEPSAEVRAALRDLGYMAH